ncbi:hypothetical protein AABB24_002697 [Solanum stoloniferum]|uniref:Uncharacterized protein n=1 Tax=Solanum stoloniferum TaxID=62892 RepID=A0ABD2V6S5_9SOLN
MYRLCTCKFHSNQFAIMLPNDNLTHKFVVLNCHFHDLFKPGNHIMSIYYQALYTVTNSNYGKVYKNKEIIEIDKECAEIARIVEEEIQQSQIPEEYEIQFEKTQEIGSSSSNSRLSLEYERNFIRKSVSQRYNKNTLEIYILT